MKKRSNAIIYVLLAGITLFLVLGTVGLMASNMTKAPETNDKDNKEEKEYTVSYKYYLDGTEVKEEIKQQEVEVTSDEFEGVTEKKNMYAFKEYKCTNNVEGKWDEEKWKFTPELTANTTCRLYFVKNFHSVKITAINGSLDNNSKELSKTVELEKTAVVKVTPTTGYKYTNVECTNSAKGTFNESNNELTLSDVTKDSLCTITFGIKSYKAQVKLSNGNVEGEDTKSANYGENITFNIKPSEGYSNPTVACDNGQNASINGNTLTINGISNDTVCTVQYKLQTTTYNVSLSITNGMVLGENPVSFNPAKDTKKIFGYLANDGFRNVIDTYTCNVDGTKVEIESENNIRVSNITNNVNCEVTLKAEESGN